MADKGEGGEGKTKKGGNKEKSHVAPTKKNFTEAKEKEYVNTKSKQKDAPGKANKADK